MPFQDQASPTITRGPGVTSTFITSFWTSKIGHHLRAAQSEKFTVGVKYSLLLKEGMESETQHQGFTKNLLSLYIYTVVICHKSDKLDLVQKKIALIATYC